MEHNPHNQNGLHADKQETQKEENGKGGENTQVKIQQEKDAKDKGQSDNQRDMPPGTDTNMEEDESGDEQRKQIIRDGSEFSDDSTK